MDPRRGGPRTWTGSRRDRWPGRDAALRTERAAPLRCLPEEGRSCKVPRSACRSRRALARPLPPRQSIRRARDVQVPLLQGKGSQGSWGFPPARKQHEITPLVAITTKKGCPEEVGPKQIIAERGLPGKGLPRGAPGGGNNGRCRCGCQTAGRWRGSRPHTTGNSMVSGDTGKACLPGPQAVEGART